MAHNKKEAASSQSSWVDISGLLEQLTGISRISSEEDLALLVKRLREMDHEEPGA